MRTLTIIRQRFVEFRSLLAALCSIAPVGIRQRSRPVPPASCADGPAPAACRRSESRPISRTAPGRSIANQPCAVALATHPPRPAAAGFSLNCSSSLAASTRIVIPALERVSGRQVVNVVPVMAIAVKLSCAIHPRSFSAAAANDFSASLPAAGLRINCPGMCSACGMLGTSCAYFSQLGHASLANVEPSKAWMM